MSNIFVRYIPLPTTTKGLTVQDADGDYNIYLNVRHTCEAHTETLQHEIKHIESNDFSSPLHIRNIEK